MSGLGVASRSCARLWGAAGAACALALACNSPGDVPSKSRVQSVLAEPGASGARGAAAPPSQVTPTSEPAPKRPRPPLCADQLDDKPKAFKPKRMPTRMAMDGAPDLPASPLSGPPRRWTWINFWAAWCVPCKDELPLLFKWQEDLGDRLSFAFISLDDDERQLREFMERQPATGLRSTYWLPDGELRQSWLELLNTHVEPELPLQLLIDPSGMLRCRVDGAVEAEDRAALERIIASRRD